MHFFERCDIYLNKTQRHPLCVTPAELALNEAKDVIIARALFVHVEGLLAALTWSCDGAD